MESRKKESIEKKLFHLLIQKKKTLACAESCTGGLVSNRITNIAGSSKYFLGSIVSYSNSAKVALLNVPEKNIKKYGAVSSQTCLAMAKGVKSVFSADISTAVTGIAGPGGGTSKKPVGLAFIAVISGSKKSTRKVFFKGSRESIKNKFATAVLEMVYNLIG
ncbi:MAG: CinA family protein [Candidatus Omnitrophota bacterium]|nr:CinA family protein [Candidatus Omnitrophota bacterium]MBU1894833.1 CinA family protein [Candidatus Omnitrophota bacterium]